MPWDSAATNAMISGYQQSAFQNLAYSQQLSLGGMSGQPGMFAEQAMGAGMNRLQGWGSPLLQAGMGVAGLDPMSLALKAGGAGFRAGGVLGAGLGGMAAFGGATAGLAVAGYAANQMFTGMQQQQGVNSALRSSFNFFNQQTGGQGFSLNQMGQVGGMMRSMSHQPGPGGEVVGMGELSSLAANMGRMGLSQNVRDVQDFGRKFREMVTNLKTIAQEMGTSLQEAQQFTLSMRNSGIFRASDQVKFANMAKQTAFSGNLALSEVTGMASIGSQIGRSIGGTGRAGAFAGMRTIGQIGTAQQMGLISDEDIYNTTGLTGAEGRQAFAASSLQNSARFLMSGRGRRTLASIAGANGALDEGAVSQLLSGDMGISETMRHGGQNLSKIGRANFIRNEGRLRGAALERLGGFLPAIQLSQWAQSKGLDLNEMDDRSMLFGQRQLGMGRDEFESSLKIAQRLPEIMREQRSSGLDQRFMDRQAAYRKDTGLEGVKNRMNQAKERVNSTLQSIGQGIFQEGSEMIERWVNDLAGTYEMRYSKDLERAFRSGGLSSTMQQKMQALTANRIGAGVGPGLASANFFRGSMGTGFGLTNLLQGQSMAGRFKDAGYDIAGYMGGSQDPTRLARELREVGDIQRAANQGPDRRFMGMSSKNADWLSEAFATGAISGRGRDRMKSFEDVLMARGTNEMQVAWTNAINNPAERARMMATAAAVARGGDPRSMLEGAREEAGMFGSPDTMLMGGGDPAAARKALASRMGYSGADGIVSGFREGAVAGVENAFGGDVVGGIRDFARYRDAGSLGRAAVGVGRGIGLALGGVPAALGNALYGGIRGAYQAQQAQEERAVAYGAADDLMSDESAMRISALRSSDAEVRSQARRGLLNEMQALHRSTKPLDVTQQARLKSLSTQYMGTETLRMKQMLAAGQISKEQFMGAVQRIGEASGNRGPFAVMNGLAAMNAANLLESSENDAILQGNMARVRADAAGEMGEVQTAGLGSFEGGSFRLGGDAEKRFGKLGAGFLSSMGASIAMASGVNYKGGMEAIQGQRAMARGMLRGMSMTDRRKLAQGLAESGAVGMSEYVSESIGAEARVGRGMSRGGVAGGLAGGLGVSLSKEQRSAINAAVAGGDLDKAGALAAQFTSGGDVTAAKDFSKAFRSIKAGRKGEAGDILGEVAEGNEGFKKARQREKEAKDAAAVTPGDQAIIKAIGDMSKAVVQAVGNINTGNDPAGGGAKPSPTGK